jgi:hypothetical protein
VTVRNIARAIVTWTLQLGSVLAALLILPLRLLRRAASRSVYSVWTGTPIITIAVNARAERLLGCRAHSIVTQTYFITDAFDYDLSRLARLRIVGRLVPYAVFLWICLAADRVHFFCDGGLFATGRRFLFSPLERFAYRLLGVRLFLWTYGADVRTREATIASGTPNCCTDCSQVRVACICDDALQKRRYRSLAASATAVFSMGDMTAYTPGSVNDAFFWPIDLRADAGRRYEPRFPAGDPGRPLRIVHASNHRMFKGTKYLEAAVAELRAEGAAVELVLVEKVPNREALEIYRSADVIFDQCLIGFHGYFALEAMALGKPVMCFIRDPGYLIAPEECPLINIHVSTLKQDIRRLVEERSGLREIGERGRRYVEKHHSVEAFSGRLGRAYERLGVRAA